MAYRALYRVYRPALFHEVMGQGHITAVLQNQVQLGRLSHAYLFCGPRGTGKTTMAKILSRAVNCLHPVNGEPCGECEMCRISAGVNADILEIDAASNNGVDNVREMIDQAQFAPLQLKKRVFIIDEVHMLSAAAFNALLKTLEEPPEHVLFILATTEPQKLLATVVSRCQRFDFKRIGMADIVAYMESVLEKEGVSAETDALRAVAHAASGGMRDALSLLNQVLSVAGNTLRLSDVREVLGTVEEDFLFSLTDMLLDGNCAGCMDAMEEIVRQGRDLNIFAGDLAAHIRSLMLTEACGCCADLLECTEETAARYEKQAKRTSRERLLYFSEQLIAARTSMRYFPNPRLLLETTLLRMASPEGEQGSEAISARLAALEEKSENRLILRIAELEKRLAELETAPVQYAKPAVTRTAPAKQSALQPEPSAEKDETPLPEPPVGEEAPPWEELPETAFGEPPPEEPLPYEDVPVDAGDAFCPEPEHEFLLESFEAEEDISGQTAEDLPNAEAGVAADASEEAAAVLAELKKAMTAENPMLGMVMGAIDGIRLDKERLILLYPPEAGGKLSLLMSAKNKKMAQELAEEIRPGVTVSFMERETGQESKEVRHLRELLGDKLIVE